MFDILNHFILSCSVNGLIISVQTASIFMFKTSPFVHPLEGYNKHEYCISLALGDLKATIGVRISLTTFLLTYFQVRTILKFKGWLLLDRTLLLGNQQLTS